MFASIQPPVYAAVKGVVRQIFAANVSYIYVGKRTADKFDNDKRLVYVPEGYEFISFYSDEIVFSKDD